MGFHDPISRRRFLKSAGLLVGSVAVPGGTTSTVHAARNVLSLPGGTPRLEQGIQIGDVRADRAVIWSRSDRAAQLLVEYDVSEHFANPIRVRGPFALETSDYTARVDLTGLRNDSEIFVRVMFQDLSNDHIVSDPFRAPSVRHR